MKVEAPSTELETLATQRGISTDTLLRAGIHTSNGERHQGWWAIPYPHRLGVWKTRYRNPHPQGRPKYLDDPGADVHLYNPALLGPGEDEVWFCEGEFDTLALLDQGYKAIGISGATNIPDNTEDGQVKDSQKFRKSWVALFEGTLCIVVFDNDDAGRHGGRRLAAALGGVAFDRWVQDYSDVNEWHKDNPGQLGRVLTEYRLAVRAQRGMR